MSSTIHFIGGEKGGVGKSFTARLLAQYHIDNQIPFAGFDTDQSHTTFSRFYNEFTNSVATSGEALDQIFEHLYDHPGSDIIVDLAAQTAKNLYSWMEDCDFFSLTEEINAQVYFWHVLDDSADCKNLLHTTLAQLKNKPCQVIVVKNHGCGENFIPLESSETYRRALAQGVKVIDLPGLPKSVNQKMDFDNLSFWAAANNPHWLNRIERQRTAVFLKKAFSQIEQILSAPYREQATTTIQGQTETH